MAETMEKQKKLQTLKENHLFAKAYARGKCFPSRTVVLYVRGAAAGRRLQGWG